MEDPSGSVVKALLAAVAADDDILTQEVEVSGLRERILKAKSFGAIVQVQNSAGAVDV
jgi:hypothetical protein